MNRKNRALLLLLGVLMSLSGITQVQTVLDGAYVKEHNPTRKVISYPYLREADVMWARRIWQVIDLKQKINHPLYFPIDALENRKSLFDVIKIGLLDKGSITAYGLGPTQDDDEFRYPLGQTEIDSMLNPVRLRYVENLETGEKEETRSVEPVTSRDVVGYKLKEDWIFDKQRSERYVRIIGIAPITLKYSETGEVKGKQELFWLYYPECRYVFNNFDVFNAHNGSQQMTFDQLFQMRMFQGYVVKEDNVYNRPIDPTWKGIDALMESERIKGDLFVMEHDLWHY
ncbi:MAG: gliding motility protein GldN [Flavobacteriales bacterium]|nr:gliding motility protein GldN [Flavobacteriales bacterium]